MKSDPNVLEARLKATEEAISAHLDALQEEVQRSGADVRHYLKENPWVALTASLVAGVALGMLLGKPRGQSSVGDVAGHALDRLGEIAREAGASESEIAQLLRQASRETARVQPPPPPPRQSGIMGKLFGIASGLAFDLAKRSIMNFLDERLSAGGLSKNDRKSDG